LAAAGDGVDVAAGVEVAEGPLLVAEVLEGVVEVPVAVALADSCVGEGQVVLAVGLLGQLVQLFGLDRHPRGL